MEKYYTPKIEEFHLGFRYEELTGGYVYKATILSGNKFKVKGNPKKANSWIEKEFDFEQHCYIDTDGVKNTLEDAIDLGSIRVKHLDIDDIEDLGWEEAKDIGDFRDFERYLHFTFRKNNYWRLAYDKKSSVISISSISSVLFIGNCANYNELKKLMEQLKMDNE